MKAKILLLCLCTVGAKFLDAKNPKRAIVIGASSGIGREIAKQLSKNGYTVGLVARRKPLLESLQKELSNPAYIACIDVAGPQARDQVQELITEMGGLDLMVISISAHIEADSLTWDKKSLYVDVDIKGFMAMADSAITLFKQQNSGHLVGISSTSGLRGNAQNPEYSAAKAWASYYLEAQRNYMIQNNYNVSVTDVCPGYVATEYYPMGTDPRAYWEISAKEAGKVIMAGIKKKQKMAYVPRKIWIVAGLLKCLPDSLYNKYVPWL